MPRPQGDGWRMGSQELMLILQGIVLRSVRKRERHEHKNLTNIQEKCNIGLIICIFNTLHHWINTRITAVRNCS